jgi:nucleotide-binding universal stress UspA family protein
MQKLFSNILAPIDFGKQSELAVSRAIYLCNKFKCNLHVVCVGEFVLPVHSSPDEEGNEKNSNRLKLSFLKSRYTAQLDTGLSLIISMHKGNIEQIIVEYAIRHYIDLIIMGSFQKVVLGNLFGTLSINRLSWKVNRPVLTVKSIPLPEEIRNIVLPVHGSLPIRKITLASYIAKQFNATIHLVGLTKRFEESAEGETLYMSKAYQLLRDNTNLTIECHADTDNNIADATLKYAQKVQADLIIVNSGKELLLSGFINRLFARFIFNESKIPVMTIAPAHE